MPVAAGRSVIMALESEAGSAIGGLDVRTGEPKWFTPMDDAAIWSPPPGVSMSLGLVFVADLNGTVTALHIESGATAWSNRVGQISDGPVLAEDALYAVAGGTLLALDPATGSEIWAVGDGDDSTMLHDVLAAVDETVLVIGENERTLSNPEETSWFTISGFAATDGSKLWELEATEWPVAGESVLLMHPTPSNDRGWTIDGINPATGSRLWRLKDGGYGSLRTASVLSDTAVLTALSPQSAVMIESATGHVRFRVPIDGEATAPPLIRPQGIIIGSRVTTAAGGPLGSIVMLNPVDGSIAWSVGTPSPILGQPQQINHTIVALVGEEFYGCF